MYMAEEKERERDNGWFAFFISYFFGIFFLTVEMLLLMMMTCRGLDAFSVGDHRSLNTRAGMAISRSENI